MERQKTQNSEQNIELKEKNGGRLLLPNFKIYCKAIVIKAVWYWQKKK